MSYQMVYLWGFVTTLLALAVQDGKQRINPEWGINLAISAVWPIVVPAMLFVRVMQ